MFKSSYTSDEPYIPKGFAEVWDYIGSMMFSAPLFRNTSPFWREDGIDVEFFCLNEGLKTIRNDVGEETYQKLVALSDRMRAHFEADPESKNGEVIKGRELILDMQDILKASRKRQAR